MVSKYEIRFFREMAANFTTRMRLLEWWREGDKNTERQKHMNINETHGAKTWTEKDKMGKKIFFWNATHVRQIRARHAITMDGGKQLQEVKPNMTQEIFKVKQEVTKGQLTDTESWRLTLNLIIETNEWGATTKLHKDQSWESGAPCFEKTKRSSSAQTPHT